jgi:hypothetical protein
MQTVKHTEYIKGTELDLDAVVIRCGGAGNLYYLPYVTFNLLIPKYLVKCFL